MDKENIPGGRKKNTGMIGHAEEGVFRYDTMGNMEVNCEKKYRA